MSNSGMQIAANRRQPADGSIQMAACIWQPAYGSLQMAACNWQPADGSMQMVAFSGPMKLRAKVEELKRQTHILKGRQQLKWREIKDVC